nr:MAG TPA: hypothetical protein [Caudoviricetes sp.]
MRMEFLALNFIKIMSRLIYINLHGIQIKQAPAAQMKR